jgi:hypothetical protein
MTTITTDTIVWNAQTVGIAASSRYAYYHYENRQLNHCPKRHGIFRTRQVSASSNASLTSVGLLLRKDI